MRIRVSGSKQFHIGELENSEVTVWKVPYIL